jgi:hypothetical protein
LAAEDSDNAQQFVSEEKRMTRKTANLLTFSPFWSHNPIVLNGEVFDENRMPVCRHLTNFSDVKAHSGKVPLQETPIFSWRIDGSSSACDETKTIWDIRHSMVKALEANGWQQPNSSQRHPRLCCQPLNNTLQNRFDALL